MKHFQKTLATAMALSVIASQAAIPAQALASPKSVEYPSSTAQPATPSTYEDEGSVMPISGHTLTVVSDNDWPSKTVDLTSGANAVPIAFDFAYSNVDAIVVTYNGPNGTKVHKWENITGANGSEFGHSFSNQADLENPDSSIKDTFVNLVFGGGTGGSDGEALANLTANVNDPQGDVTISIQTAGFVTEHNSLSISNGSNITLENANSEHQVPNRGEFEYRWLVASGYEVTEVTVSDEAGQTHTVNVGGSQLVLPSPDQSHGETKVAVSNDGSKGYVKVMITDMLQDLQIHAEAHRTSVNLTSKGENVTGTSSVIQWKGESSVVITPAPGFNISSLTANGSALTIGGNPITVMGVELTAVRNADGTVTVTGRSTGDNSFSDIEIVANAVKDMYVVDVTTDTFVTSSIYAASLTQGQNLEMTFTPDSGYDVSLITVTYNGSTGTVPVTGGYGMVGGRAFNTSVTSAGVVKLTMQDIGANVSVDVKSTKQNIATHKVTVTTDANTSGDSVDIVEGNTHNLVLTPKSGYEVSTVELSYKGAYRTLALTGQTQVIDGLSFYARTQADGTAIVYLPIIKDNVTINAKSTPTNGDGSGGDSSSGGGTVNPDTTYVLSVNTDKNMNSSISSTTVKHDDTKVFTITPDSGYEAASIQVTYAGNTATLPVDGTAITVGDCSFQAKYQSNGSVQVSVFGIKGNVTVNATSRQVVGQSHFLNINTDANTSANVSSGNVTAGSSKSVTFTPNSGYSLDAVRITYDGKSGTLTTSSTSLTLSGVTFSLSNTSNGAATLNISSMDGAVTVNATSTKDSASNANYRLSVTTDSRIKSDVTSEDVKENATKVVTFTPDYKFSVASIALTYNNETKNITMDGEAFRVGGKIFTATRLADGKIQVEIPTMEGDVSMSAKSGAGSYLVEVLPGKFTEADVDEETYLGLYEKLTVTFKPSAVATLKGLTVTTASGPSSAMFAQEKISVDGYYYDMGLNADGSGYIVIDQTDRDLKIEPIIDQFGYLVTIVDEAGVTHNKEKKEAVEEGEDYSVTFTPDSGYYIEGIELTYGEKAYEVDISGGDDSISINNKKHPISIAENGAVTLQILGVDDNMTFVVDARSSEGYEITKKQDFFTNISFTGTNPFDEDDTTTVTVTPANGYEVAQVTLTDSKDKVTFKNGAEKFVFNGETYTLRWNNDDSCSFTLNGLQRDLTITSVGQTYNAGTGQSVVARHEAYLAGYGNGMFGVNSSMTRAEAVTMLTTLFFPNQDYTVSGNQHFIDVAGNVWYTNPVNFAASQGYLDMIIRESGKFNPDEPVTRAELVVLMCSYAKMSIPSETLKKTFNDVEATYWAYQYIQQARINGWSVGYEDNTFRPDNQITRAEVSVMINRVLGRNADRTATYHTSFTDVSPSHWAYHDIMEATNTHNVVAFNGDGEQWA